MSVIEVERLTKDYGSGRGVFDVTFRVDSGEVFGFLGPNGAGKSTTIRHLMGFSRPDSGKAKIFGKESFGKYHQILGRVGYIPGELALPAALTGWEFLRMIQDMKGKRDDKLLDKLLEMFELDPSGRIRHMSFGAKRKLAVVAAFMNDPEVLILDEPTSGLDPVMQQVFIDYIINEKKRGKTILLSSHIFSEVDATCDRIAIIKDGRIVSNFMANDLKHAELKNYRITFAGQDEYSRFRSLGKNAAFMSQLEGKPSECSVVVSVLDRHINDFVSFLSGFRVTGFEHLKITLEDYFMSYYKEDKDFGGALTRLKTSSNLKDSPRTTETDAESSISAWTSARGKW